MIFISVHIPKTAGTSLAYVFDHGTDRAVLYDYRADYTNFMFSAEEETQFLQARDYVLSKFRFIHGHFCLAKYRSILPMAQSVTCFRDPVERTISQYRHVWYEADESSPAYRKLKAGMDIVAFSEHTNIANAQSLHLGGLEPRELDFIFLNHSLDEGMRLFRTKYPGVLLNEWARLPSLNTGETREQSARREGLTFTENQMKKVVGLHASEHEYYRSAVTAYALQKAALEKSAAASTATRISAPQ